MENETIQILELFGGIGSPRCALRNLNIAKMMTLKHAMKVPERHENALCCRFLHAIERNIRRCSRMTGRIKIIRKTTSVVDGRRQQEEQDFFSCWCDVKSLGTNEKYNALQIGLENTIVFETRACDKMEEIRLNLKEFYAVYKGVEFKIYDACPMFTDDRKYQLKCRAGA